MSFSLGWEEISIYLLGYLLIYFLTHTTLDIVMILKPRGKIRYPYAISHNIVGILCYSFSSVAFWFFIIIIPLRTIVLEENTSTTLQLVFPESVQFLFQIIGIIIMTFGLIIGALGRWARGFYLCHNTHQLQTRLGFAVVRHPNYFQYVCGFIGFPLLTFILGSFLLLLGIYGYYVIATQEEERLLLEFDDYFRYQQNVGMLFPKVLRSKGIKKKSYTTLKKRNFTQIETID
ncbi:MAG: isoprenylcysteine carboxylmethyltransferase family protein [Candidatus Lokiarchaeota archaeon]|nr:isoprenylcysteine carboxylmethyltransferase family protein [Candidatus Lokiarchaeota archaeon]